MLMHPLLTWHKEDGAVIPNLRISFPLSGWTNASHESPTISGDHPFVLTTRYSTGTISDGGIKVVFLAVATTLQKGVCSDTLQTTV
jgi:hypothetical protein